MPKYLLCHHIFPMKPLLTKELSFFLIFIHFSFVFAFYFNWEQLPKSENKKWKKIQLFTTLYYNLLTFQYRSNFSKKNVNVDCKKTWGEKHTLLIYFFFKRQYLCFLRIHEWCWLKFWFWDIFRSELQYTIFSFG